MYRKLSKFGVALALLGSLFSTQVSAAVLSWDVGDDFSNILNPNGVWAFREGENVLPQTANWSGLVVVQPAWSRQDLGVNFLPSWMKSVVDNPLGSDGTTIDVRTGDVFVHSTDNFRGPGGVANVTWTSPIDGVISVSGAAWITRDIGRSNTWELFLNGVSLSSGSVFSGDPFDRDNPFDFATGSGGGSALLNLAVSTGDVLRLDIARTSSAGDLVGVELTIDAVSAIPIPAALPLFGSALAALGFFGWRRRFSA